MKDARKSWKTDSPTPRRTERYTAAVVTEYIHELSLARQRPLELRTQGERRPS